MSLFTAFLTMWGLRNLPLNEWLVLDSRRLIGGISLLIGWKDEEMSAMTDVCQGKIGTLRSVFANAPTKKKKKKTKKKKKKKPHALNRHGTSWDSASESQTHPVMCQCEISRCRMPIWPAGTQLQCPRVNAITALHSLLGLTERWQTKSPQNDNAVTYLSKS